MSGFLLDTNVISELTRPAPNANVLAFLEEARDLWVSTATMHELAFGIALQPEGRRRSAIAQTVAAFTAAYADRIIPLAEQEADRAAILRAKAQQSGRTVSLGDALIAGTAAAHGLAVVTRNVSDFEGLDVVVVNPWEE